MKSCHFYPSSRLWGSIYWMVVHNTYSLRNDSRNIPLIALERKLNCQLALASVIEMMQTSSYFNNYLPTLFKVGLVLKKQNKKIKTCTLEKISTSLCVMEHSHAPQIKAGQCSVHTHTHTTVHN